MKNLGKIPAVLLTLLFFTAGIGNVFAQQYNSENDFEYGWDKNVKDGIEITKYVGNQKEVRIPPTIKNLKVISIGAGAFRYNRNITSVTIPNGVVIIENGGPVGGVFQNCTSLASVTIPNSVTTIGEKAFSNCTSLARVTIGNGVTTIGKDSFNGCSSIASVIIPRSVTKIEANAFQDCTNLTSVTFQGTIVRGNFGAGGLPSADGSPATLFPGDLAARYLDTNGGPGTYIRLANGRAWRKQ